MKFNLKNLIPFIFLLLLAAQNCSAVIDVCENKTEYYLETSTKEVACGLGVGVFFDNFGIIDQGHDFINIMLC